LLCCITFAVVNIGLNSVAMVDEKDEEFEEQQFLFMMEEAYTQKKGEWQVIFTAQYMDGKKSREVEYEDEEKEDKLKIRDEWRWIAEIEYGILDWLQLEVEIPLAYVDQRTIKESEDSGRTISDLKKGGLSDINACLRARLLKEDVDQWWLPTVSAGFEVIFPTGNWEEGLGTDRYGWEGKLAISKVIDKFVVHLNGGMGRTDNAKEEGETENIDEQEFECGAALVYRPTDRLDFICETLAGFEEEKTAGGKNYETEFYLTPGIRYKLFKDFEIGAGVPVGLTYASSDWGIMTKAQYEW